MVACDAPRILEYKRRVEGLEIFEVKGIMFWKGRGE